MDEGQDELLLMGAALVVTAAIREDEVEENRKEVVAVDIEGWRRLDGISFQRHFRMERYVFQKLVVVFGNHLRNVGRLERLRTPLDVVLMEGMWVLFNPDTHRSGSSQLGVTDGVEFFHYKEVIEALRELTPVYIRWPSQAERDIIKTQFEQRYGYPGVVCCIDGTPVNMTAPLEQPQRYVDRHHNYCILIQAAADHNLLFRDVYVGEPGSVGDNRMFERSPLSTNLLRRPDMLGPDEHLLGDGAYTLTDKVLIPYVNDGQLTPRQRRHNLIHSSTRASVERSFGLLMGKFRRLKFHPNFSLELAIDHTMASLVAHNFIILDGDEPQGLHGNGVHIGVHLREEPREALMRAAKDRGAMKRLYISQLLHPE